MVPTTAVCAHLIVINGTRARKTCRCRLKRHLGAPGAPNHHIEVISGESSELQYIWKPRWLRSGRPAAQRRIGSEPKKRSKKKTDGRCHWPTWKGIICCSTGFCPLPCDALCPAWNWGLGTLNAFYHFSRLGSWFSLHPINIANTDSLCLTEPEININFLLFKERFWKFDLWFTLFSDKQEVTVPLPFSFQYDEVIDFPVSYMILSFILCNWASLKID